MLIVSGTLLTLGTWFALAVVVFCAGFGLSALTSQFGAKFDVVLRRSIWWGFTLFLTSALIASVFVPLRSALAFGIVTVILLVSVVISVFVMRKRFDQSELNFRRVSWSWSLIVVVVTVSLVATLLAVRGLGPANNYDTGLYHLGAVQYAGDFGTIPGLANILNAFGYSNSVVPGAAFLGNGPWNGNGYRFFNGFIAFLVLIDLVIRVAFRSKSVGTYLLVIGVTGMFLPLIAVTDFWVTSPTSDSAIMLLTLVSAVYLSDFVASGKDMYSNAGVVGATLVLLISMRPTMLFFAAASFFIVLLVFVARKSFINAPQLVRSVSTVGVIAFLVGSVQIMRDYLLSGWLLYPLSLLPFDVSWRALDPTSLREATLAAARDPSAAEYWPVAHSWMWIDEWFAARWSMWETYFWLLGSIVLAGAVVVAVRSSASMRLKALLLTVFPSVIAVATWFTVSPPSYRFIWGPLFLTFMIPLAFVLHSIHKSWISPALLSGLVAVLGSVTIFTAIARVDYGGMSTEGTWAIGPLSVPYSYAPSPLPGTQEFMTESGLVVRTLIYGEQCWAVFPLCTVNPNPSLTQRGESIQDGFAIIN